MSACPSWSRLVAHRLAGPDAEPPAGWTEALEHLETCAACRAEAYAVDPALVFRRLPEVPVGAEDVAAMRAGVETLRRAKRIEAGAETSSRAAARAAEKPPAGDAAAWKRLAAAAVLATALLAVHGPRAGGPPAEPPPPSPTPAVATDAGLEPYFAADGEILDLWASLPVAVDDVDYPIASVYHIDDEELDVMMVVGDGLDV